MKQAKKRRCVKFTGYIYLPTKEDLEDVKVMSTYAVKQMGRLQLFDEYWEKIDWKMKAFDEYWQMVSVIAKHYKKLFKSI